MGFLLAISVFVYPLALPVVTLVAMAIMASSVRRGITALVARASIGIPVLLLLFSPGVVSTGAGSFLLPWWLHLMVGHTGVTYYALQYALGCGALLGAFSGLIAICRAIAAMRK